MTENEAIKMLEAPNKHINMIPVDGKDTLCYSSQLVGAFETAIKAIEKQVPKKPIDVSRLSDGFGLVGRCPNCSGIIDDSYIYCDDCGQKLDWEGGE